MPKQCFVNFLFCESELARISEKGIKSTSAEEMPNIVADFCFGHLMNRFDDELIKEKINHTKNYSIIKL